MCLLFDIENGCLVVPINTDQAAANTENLSEGERIFYSLFPINITQFFIYIHWYLNETETNNMKNCFWQHLFYISIGFFNRRKSTLDFATN